MATEHEEAPGDYNDEVESVEDEEGRDLANRILQFPNVLSALQHQKTAEMLANLPQPVKRRLKALKKLQLEVTNIEAKFFKEVHELECKYNKLYVPFYEKRNTIVNGEYEPNDAECEWASDEEEPVTDIVKGMEETAITEKEKEKKDAPKEEPEAKGIPNFWITIFKNISLLSDMIQPHDEPILAHLTDIKSICKEDPMSFTLEFHFTPNDYFTNTVLTKEYELKCTPEEDDPFSFEGPEIYKCAGCTINWKKGKNVTVKTLKKKQKHKTHGVIRTVVKTVHNDSFFNFFAPPVIPEDQKEEDIDDDLRNLLTTDFEIGHYLRERIIPRAVLYFTGEAVEEEEDYDDEDEEEDEESDEEEGDPKYVQENCKQQ